MRIEKRIVKPIPTEYETEVYIADDGTEFNDKWECKQYEERQKCIKALESIKKYKIKFEGVPLDDDGHWSNLSTYRWYKVNNEDELNEICEVFDDFVSVKEYPAYVCFETSEDNYIGTASSITLEEIMEITQEFFERFGMEVEFK